MAEKNFDCKLFFLALSSKFADIMCFKVSNSCIFGLSLDELRFLMFSLQNKQFSNKNTKKYNDGSSRIDVS